MKSSIGVPVLCAIVLLFAMITVVLPAAETGKRPNVLLILVDDLGYGDLSCMGGPNMQTPYIDTLATGGMRFTQFRANSSVCSPSRAALLSGMFPDRAGVPGVIRTHDEDSWGRLAVNLTLLPAALKKQGYHSAIVGKWHLGLESPNTPNQRGFDFFHGFLGDMMDDYYTHRRHDINYLRRNNEIIDPPGHATDLFTDWACDYLRERESNKNQPFFLYLAYNAPHGPIQPPQEYLKRVLEREPGIDEKRAKLVALIEHLDDGVGRVLQTLRDTGFEQNTLVIFTSDNGGQVDIGAYNGPHRGTKGEMYEGGLKVPCLVRWPNRITPGTQTDAQAVLMDLFPTILEAAGSHVDATGRSTDGIFQQRIDGVSLCDLLFGKTEQLPERSLYFVRREGGPQFAGKTNDAVIRGHWKILQNTPFSSVELYDIQNDPMEENDLRTKAPGQYQQMVRQWMLHIQEGGRTPWQAPRE